jgi:hypothetical protein
MDAEKQARITASIQAIDANGSVSSEQFLERLEGALARPTTRCKRK